MKQIHILTLGIVLAALTGMPAQAFTLKALTVQVGENGDATMDIRYELSLLEQSAVFLKIADPASELKSAFDGRSQAPVTVTGATSSSAQVLVPGFATVTAGMEGILITTPVVSFERARDVLNSYWFAPLVSPDFSPAVTTVIFPDGHYERFSDQSRIPSLTRAIRS